MAFARDNYNKVYAPNTRETFRRQVLHQFVQGQIADYNPDNPDMATNSPKAHYAISHAALLVAQAYGTKQFKIEVQKFKGAHDSLVETYQKNRKKHLVSVTLPNGKKIKLSPGDHNQLQKQIIESFASRFIQKPVAVYIGDTKEKALFIDKDFLKANNVNVTEHGKLPDVVIFDKKHNWIFLIEAVTSHGPMNPKRVFELKNMFEKCPIGLVYVSTFLNNKEFMKHFSDISWETEAWVADTPDHMIHLNGDRFMGPR